jgi:uncharacterized protein YdhG (YjbR/CyaY superfamily)
MPKSTFTAEEKAAMKEAARERKRGSADGEADLLAKVAEMGDADRAMAEKVHALVTAAAPDLQPKTWYGMPAYASKDGKVVCHFQPAEKFKTRYATFGFSELANLDSGSMWPVAFALAKWNKTVEAELRKLVKQAVS